MPQLAAAAAAAAGRAVGGGRRGRRRRLLEAVCTHHAPRPQSHKCKASAKKRHKTYVLVELSNQYVVKQLCGQSNDFA